MVVICEHISCCVNTCFVLVSFRRCLFVQFVCWQEDERKFSPKLLTLHGYAYVIVLCLFCFKRQLYQPVETN